MSSRRAAGRRRHWVVLVVLLAAPGALVTLYAVVAGTMGLRWFREVTGVRFGPSWEIAVRSADPSARGDAVFQYFRADTATESQIRAVAHLLSDSVESVRTLAASALIAVGKRVEGADAQVLGVVQQILAAKHDSSTADLAATILEKIDRHRAHRLARGASAAAYNRNR